MYRNVILRAHDSLSLSLYGISVPGFTEPLFLLPLGSSLRAFDGLNPAEQLAPAKFAERDTFQLLFLSWEKKKRVGISNFGWFLKSSSILAKPAL